MGRILAPIFVSLLVSGCGGTPASRADAQNVAKVLSGDDKLAAADNRQCRLFTRAEIAKYVGEPVSAGRNAAGGLGCQWLTAATHSDGGHGDVIVTIVPAQYHERPTLAQGFKEVPEVGTKGFVAPDMGGWVAGAIVGNEAIKVSVAGATAGETSAIALLKETIKRHAS
jgi:hypothetical protein